MSKLPPFSVEFPSSRHDFVLEPLQGGGALNLAIEPVWVLWVRSYHGNDRNFAGSWRGADAYGEAGLTAVVMEQGFDVAPRTGLETIMEKAVRVGLARRIGANQSTL